MGAAKREAYQAGITRAFETLSANPQIGPTRDEISPGLRSYKFEQHVIFYRVSGGEVTVVRILHGKMDAARHIEG